MSAPSPTLTAARILKLKNEAEFVALKSSILRGDHLHRRKLETALQDIMLGIKQIVESSRLSPEEKSEISQNLAQLPIVLRQVRQDQRQALAQSEVRPKGKENGDDGL